MNPLNWTAWPFLILYVALAGVILIWLGWKRNHFGPAARDQGFEDLDVLQTAYLAGGHARAMDTALVALFEAQSITYDRRRATAHAGRLAFLPAALRGYPIDVPEKLNRRRFHNAFAASGRQIRVELARRGLFASEPEITRFYGYAIMILAVPLLLGLAKISVGISRGRPVGILTSLVILTALVGGWIIMQGPHRSRAGGTALRAIKLAKARMARAPRESEVLLAFALTGAAVLAGRSYQAFFSSSGDGSSGGCGTGGSSGCGGGGGCGGCGS